MGKKLYGKKFYNEQMNGSIKSASKIVPFVLEMLKPFEIQSVIDFGCGVGGWLTQFQKVNSCNIQGLDFGDADKSQLLIPENNFKKIDLSQAVDLKKKYDLCISLEVAEHIQPEFEDVFIDNLCRHSDIILFSAAMKGQGGTGHVNEQKISYWVKKFQKRDYTYYDFIRPHFWYDTDIDVWYKQNMLIFIKTTINTKNCKFKCLKETYPIDIAHPITVWEWSKTYDRIYYDTFFNLGYIYKHHKFLYKFLRSIIHVFKRK